MPIPLMPPLAPSAGPHTIGDIGFGVTIYGAVGGGVVAGAIGDIELGVTITGPDLVRIGGIQIQVLVYGSQGWNTPEHVSSEPDPTEVGVRIYGTWRNPILPPVTPPPPSPDPEAPPPAIFNPPPAMYATGVGTYQSEHQFTRSINDAGSGSVTSRGGGGGGDVFFVVGGAVKFGGYTTTTTDTSISPDEDAGITSKIGVTGFLREWEYMRVLPDLGAESPERIGAPSSPDRHFNWAASTGIDTSKWKGAVKTKANYDGDPKDKDPKKRPNFIHPKGWPWMQSEWVWDRDTAGGGGAGDVYLRKVFDGSGYAAVHIACDDEYELWLDGVKLGGRTGYYSGQVEKYDVILGDHFHLIALHCSTRGGKAGLNMAVMPYADTATPSHAFTQSDEGMKCLASKTPPGFSVGKIILTLLEEAQARGAMQGWSCGFSDKSDSNGVPWPIVDDYALNIGMDGLSVLGQMGDAFFDYWCAPGSRTLICTQSGSIGGGGHEAPLTEYQVMTDTSQTFGSVLVSYDGPDGCVYVGGGGREGALKADGVQTKKAAQAIGAAWLSVFGRPRTTAMIKGLPRGEGGPESSYDYDIGVPINYGRVSGVSCTMDEDGKVIVVPEITDSLQLDEQKLHRTLLALSSGSVGQAGGPGNTKPYLDTVRPGDDAQLPPFGIHGVLADIGDTPMPSYTPVRPLVITRIFATLREFGTTETIITLAVGDSNIATLKIPAKKKGASKVVANLIVKPTDTLAYVVSKAGKGAEGLTIQTMVSYA